MSETCWLTDEDETAAAVAQWCVHDQLLGRTQGCRETRSNPKVMTLRPEPILLRCWNPVASSLIEASYVMTHPGCGNGWLGCGFEPMPWSGISDGLQIDVCSLALRCLEGSKACECCCAGVV
jgi:hypothetical protein